MRKISLESLSHIAFIVACGVLAAAALPKFLASESMPRATERVHRGNIVPPALFEGIRSAPRTVLVVVSSTCKYCNDSMPFYKRLQDKISFSADRVRLVVASKEPVETTRRYLALHGIEPAGVSMLVDGLVLSGTPTLLVTDAQGVVQDGWLGRLTPNQESAVLKLVASTKGN